MQLTSTCFAKGQPIPNEFAFCIPYRAHHICQRKDLDQQQAWSDIPSGQVTARGKPWLQTLDGARQGTDNHTDWFAGDSDMRGNYYAYAATFLPWNDAIVHRYVFKLFATDIERQPLEDGLSEDEIRDSIENHALAQTSPTRTYMGNRKLDQI